MLVDRNIYLIRKGMNALPGQKKSSYEIYSLISLQNWSRMWHGVGPRQLRAGFVGGHYIPAVSSPDPSLMFSHQDLHRRYESAPDSAKTKALQTVIEMKVGLACVFHVWINKNIAYFSFKLFNDIPE